MSVTTFADDLLGLEDFSKRLEKFIDTEHHFVEGGLVLALSSKYGTGKTTFLNMWRSALIAADDKKRIVVSLNAWESDYLGDPLFSIISSLTHTFSAAGKDVNRVVEAAKDVGWFVTAIGSQVVEKYTGIKPVEAGELAEQKKHQRHGLTSTSNAFSEFEKRKDAMMALKKAIQDLIGSESPRVLFLVDELDRCRPDYAISYLETIKHIFDISGAVFILAADREQLENSARTAFGEDLDFEEYYRKFVHREVTLPQISPQAYRKIANEYVEYYLSNAEKRSSILQINEGQINNICELITKLKLTPRQIQEVFRTLGHLCETEDRSKYGRLYWCIGVGSVAMCIFKVGDPDSYHNIGNKILDFKQAISLFTFLDEAHLSWWLAILFSGQGLSVPASSKFEVLMEQHKVSTNMPMSSMNEFYSGWGLGGLGSFPEIYNKIQHIDQWK